MTPEGRGKNVAPASSRQKVCCKQRAYPHPHAGKMPALRFLRGFSALRGVSRQKLVDRFRNNISIAHTTERDSSLYFHRKITGSSLTSRRYISMRARSSSLELTRMPRRSVLAILPKKDSIRFSHEPCVGVKTNSKRLGTVVK